MLRILALFALSGAATALDFSGTGQIRAVSGFTESDTGLDVGCLTDSGMWVANNDTCGTFTAVRASDLTDFTLSTLNGDCGIINNDVICGEGVAAWSFWVRFPWVFLLPLANLLTSYRLGAGSSLTKIYWPRGTHSLGRAGRMLPKVRRRFTFTRPRILNLGFC
jgi:hypothetical protein